MDALEHSGVKGMRWGVRHEKAHKGTDNYSEGTPIKKRSKLSQHLNSLKREREWGQVLHQIHSMSTKDIRIVKKRIDLENDLKKYSKSKVATKKDKADYLRREEMSDEEIARKVTRLKAKDSLYASVKEASKAQREFGAKVVQIGSSIGVKYAINRKVGLNDVFDIAKNPKEASGKARSDALDYATGKVTNAKLKTAIDYAKKANEIKKANQKGNSKS
jgi:hypothetical protein